MQTVGPVKSLAEFAAAGGEKVCPILADDRCVSQNTSQTASMEFLRSDAEMMHAAGWGLCCKIQWILHQIFRTTPSTAS